MTDQIIGLGQGALDFLDALKANNNRDWFAENKARFEVEVKAPALALADQLSAGLGGLTGRRQKAKLFRIHRDLRFSKDKTPYNTDIHIALSDVEISGAPMWFWGLDTRGFGLGMGVFGFDKPELEAFCDYVASDKGAGFADLVDDLRGRGVRVSEPALKRVPPGFPADHPRAQFLRMKAFSAWIEHANRSRALGPGAADHGIAEFSRLLPLYRALSGALRLTL